MIHTARPFGSPASPLPRGTRVPAPASPKDPAPFAFPPLRPVECARNSHTTGPLPFPGSTSAVSIRTYVVWLRPELGGVLGVMRSSEELVVVVVSEGRCTRGPCGEMREEKRVWSWGWSGAKRSQWDDAIYVEHVPKTRSKKSRSSRSVGF